MGTGPFVFKDYKPGESFTATKNPDYWNKPYPYLDEFETRVIPDALTRASALEAGDVDLIQTTNGDTIKKFRGEADKFPMLEETDYGETGYTLLNVGDPTSPLADQRVRCAMAYATDNQAIIDKVDAGVLEDRERSVLTGAGRPPRRQRLPGEAGHGQGARARRESYKADHPGPLKISLSTTQDATNLIIAQAQQEFFKQAGFDDVQITQIEQAKYILTALQGTFQAFQWRNHGGYDLDSQYIWWTADNALPAASARAQLRAHQGPGDRQGARRQPRRDRPGTEEGRRRDGQQGVRDAVLQPLGLVDRSGGCRTLRTSWTSACSSTPTARSRAPGPVAPSTSARSGSTRTPDA